MANKPKIGLTYFPFEVSFFDDIKTRKLIKYQGGKSISVYTHLLCTIYNNGYYVKWDNELPFMISEKTGLEEGYVGEVIQCCLNVGLLSKVMYEKNKVLTSKGIQDRYILICKQAKRMAIVSEYLVNSSEDIQNPSEEFPQSKVKEIKENQSKGNYLRLREKVIHSKVSDFIKESYPIFLGEWQLINKKISAENVLAQMDKDFICYSFNNENHLKNSFKSTFEKLKKSGKNTKIISTEKSYDNLPT